MVEGDWTFTAAIQGQLKYFLDLSSVSWWQEKLYRHNRVMLEPTQVWLMNLFLQVEKVLR